MILHRAKSTLAVVVLGLALATMPVAINQAGATKHHPKPKTTHASSGVSTAGCTAVTHVESQASSVESSLEKAFASANFSTIKAAIVSELNLLTADTSKAQSYLSGAPANVRAAFGTVAKAYSGLKSQIELSTSLQQLEEAFTTVGENPKLAAAGKVLAGYFDTRCRITKPTP